MLNSMQNERFQFPSAAYTGSNEKSTLWNVPKDHAKSECLSYRILKDCQLPTTTTNVQNTRKENSSNPNAIQEALHVQNADNDEIEAQIAEK